jgi:hypothetical protein
LSARNGKTRKGKRGILEGTPDYIRALLGAAPNGQILAAYRKHGCCLQATTKKNGETTTDAIFFYAIVE